MKRDSETLRKTKQYFKKDQGLFDWKVAREGGDLSSYQVTGGKCLKPVDLSVELTRRLPHQFSLYPDRQSELLDNTHSGLPEFPFFYKEIVFHLCLSSQNPGDGYPPLSLSKNRDRWLGQ